MPGDRLILTKALGTGIVATALKRGLTTDAQLEAMVQSMIELNKRASEIAIQYPIRAMTDVTGYGLVGHLLEMLNASQVDAKIECQSLPLLPGALHWAGEKVVPGGLLTNQKYYQPRLSISPGVDQVMERIVVDPQTSGGLLIACPGDMAQALLEELHAGQVENARIIGEITGASQDPKINLY